MTATELQAAIARQRENVLDLQVAVDDACAQVERDLELLRATVRERDRADVHLQHLIETDLGVVA